MKPQKFNPGDLVSLTKGSFGRLWNDRNMKVSDAISLKPGDAVLVITGPAEDNEDEHVALFGGRLGLIYSMTSSKKKRWRVIGVTPKDSRK